jgi:hypothetical protein
MNPECMKELETRKRIVAEETKALSGSERACRAA